MENFLFYYFTPLQAADRNFVYSAGDTAVEFLSFGRLIVIRTNIKQVISVGVAIFNAQENAILYGPRMAVAVLSAIPLTILYLIITKIYCSEYRIQRDKRIRTQNN